METGCEGGSYRVRLRDIADRQRRAAITNRVEMNTASCNDIERVHIYAQVRNVHFARFSFVFVPSLSWQTIVCTERS
jgi:hypothetical protein